MVTEDYVSFETAKLLVRKGFDFNNEYNTYYTLGGTVCELRHSQELNVAPRVTHQMVMKWLKEKYQWLILIDLYPDINHEPKYYFELFNLNNLDEQFGVFVANIPSEESNPNGYVLIEQARESAIKYCLKNLI